MATPLPPKPNTDTVVRWIDFSPLLGEDAIVTAAITLESGTVTLSNVAWTAQQAVVTIAGGAVGETATMLVTLDTAGEQILTSEVSIYVEASATPWGPSTATKGTLLEMMWEELASAGYEFDHTADETSSALRKLDGIMLDLAVIQGVNIGYNAPAQFGGGDVNDPLGIPDAAIQTIAIALGMRQAPSWGRSMSVETKAAFARGMNMLLVWSKPIPSVKLRPGTPLGKGNKWRSTWWPLSTAFDNATVVTSA